MNVMTPLLVLGCVLLALLCIQGPKAVHRAPALSDRYASIDGLRGYLGFFVFLHHAAIWQQYVRSGEWVEPSRIFNHFGQTSVLLFFMITGFLFTGKLLQADRKPIDWLQLFVGRLMRLGPLYAVAMIVLAALVVHASGFTLQQEPSEIMRRVLHWAAFTVFYAPDINGVSNTRHIMAGVVWTLPYEWMFYLALPMVALLIRRRVPLILVGICTLIAGAIFIPNHKPMCLLAFVSGMATARLVQATAFQQFSRSASGLVLAVTCLGVTVLGFDSTYRIVPTVLVSVPFAVIAGGNSLGGLLTTATSRLLGECSYGLYLLHGFVLYIAYRLVVGMDTAAGLTPTQHWLVALACTPVLVLASYSSFRFIEAPAMRKTRAITALLRRESTSRPAAATA